MNQLLIASTFCVSTIFLQAATGPEQLDSGTKFYSPDRSTVIVYNPDQLEIRGTRTNQLYSSVTVSLLFALRWTGDSKTFVAIEHIAHGSDAIFVHLDGGQWKTFLVVPPGEEYRDYAVIELKPEEKRVRLSYSAVTDAALYLISFAVDPSTRNLSDVEKRKVSYKEWTALRMVGDKYK